MRKATISRQTKETRIELALELDGRGEYEIETGIAFLDHMLSHLALHGLFDLTVHAQGDPEVRGPPDPRRHPDQGRPDHSTK